jgi:D-alanyl-D-alanine carboxypeptidase/D-alanyl-D-alanine-endopeptidase (penicillin-binding protein 4)
MRKIHLKLKIVALLTFAALCGGFNFDAPAAAQEASREKVTGKPTPAPTVSPTPPATASPALSPAPTPIQTVAELQSKIRQTLARPELRRGSVGVKIVSLDTNRTIFEENAQKYFMPASNMKSYTVAAALEKLSPDFRFVTSVYASALPDASGTIRGDLNIYGRGDVSFSTAFEGSDSSAKLNALADKIVQAGVKRIEGNLVGDESYFTGSPIPYSWEWDDLQWKSGAEISALPVNDNLVELVVKPSQANAPCFVHTLPVNTIVKIVNRCQTAATGTEREIRVTKQLDRNVLEISGTMPLGDAGYTGNITVSRPAQLFVEMLRGLLIQKGVAITGQNKLINASEKSFSGIVFSAPTVEIAKLESPPFSIVAAKTMKPSQNAYTETILWTLGEKIGRQHESVLATDEASVKKLQKNFER